MNPYPIIPTFSVFLSIGEVPRCVEAPKGRKSIARGVNPWDRERAGYQGLTHLAIDFRPFGAETRGSFLLCVLLKDLAGDLADEHLRRVVRDPPLVLVPVGQHAQRHRAALRVN